MVKKIGKLITIHGIDGTGKTSTAIKVCERLKNESILTTNYDLIRETMDNPYVKIKKVIDKNGSLEERIEIYFKSMMLHSNNIRGLLSQGKYVVKSRFIDDVKAHFLHLGLTNLMIEKMEKSFPIIKPDLKVILYLNENKRRERINIRGVLDDRDLEEKKEGTRLYFFENYLFKLQNIDSVGSVMYVDTGDLNIDQVVIKIMDQIVPINYKV